MDIARPEIKRQKRRRQIIWSIVALVHANKGRFFYMPFFGRISFARYYGPRTERLRPAPRVWENKPPEGF